MAISSNCKDDVSSILPLCQHGRNQVGRILQVSVHRYNDVSVCKIVAAKKRALVTEVSRKRNTFHKTVLIGEGFDEWPGVIRAPVIDQYDLYCVFGSNSSLEL